MVNQPSRATSARAAWQRSGAPNVEVTSIEDPGWRVRIKIRGTSLEDKDAHARRVERTEHDSFHTWLSKHVFDAECGALDLSEVLYEFRIWAEGARAPATRP
ncbi:Imm53 family immunity protein [Motilibacter peucedani]|uniref:Imm53 family immunity protein n=1 Tax=Motilibacter peucedani TaxID=598650 RepID=UPI000EB08E5C